MKINPVVVYWIDSVGTHGWNSNDTPISDMSCVSVGHLISKTKDRVTLCLNMNPYNFGNRIEIPMVAVKKIKRLKL